MKRIPRILSFMRRAKPCRPLNLLGFVLLMIGFHSSLAYPLKNQADLELEKVEILPLHPSTDQPLQVAALIRNLSSQEVKDIFIRLDLFREKKLVKNVHDIPALSHLPRLGSGLSLYVNLGRLPQGDYEVRCQVYTQGEASDPRLDNNSLKKTIHVYSALTQEAVP